MRRHLHHAVFVLSMSIAVLGAGCSFTTAHFADVTLARAVTANMEPVERVQGFHRCDRTLYCTVKMANTPTDTKVKALWRYLPEGAAAEILDSTEIAVSEDVWIAFNLQLARNGWQYGKYSVDLSIDGKPVKTVAFDITPMITAGPVREATIASSVGEDQFPLDRNSTFDVSTDVIYSVVWVEEASVENVFSAHWYAKDENGDRATLITTDFPFGDSGWIAFSLKPNGKLAPATYFCDISANGMPVKTLSFTIGKQ